MAKVTRDDLEALQLDEDAIDAILTKQAAKAPPRTHLKHWLYLTVEQAQQVAEMYQGDPEFRMVKYSHVRKARKEGTDLPRISI